MCQSRFALSSSGRRSREHCTRDDAGKVSNVSFAKDPGWNVVFHGTAIAQRGQTMSVSLETLTSLQIFEVENHPSMHKDLAREGSSVFGISIMLFKRKPKRPAYISTELIKNTGTTMGKSLLKEWFLRPSKNLNLILARQKALQFFLQHDECLSFVQKNLKSVGSVYKFIGPTQNSLWSLREWQTLMKVRLLWCGREQSRLIFHLWSSLFTCRGSQTSLGDAPKAPCLIWSHW
jgi:hypothetical protein